MCVEKCDAAALSPNAWQMCPKGEHAQKGFDIDTLYPGRFCEVAEKYVYVDNTTVHSQ